MLKVLRDRCGLSAISTAWSHNFQMLSGVLIEGNGVVLCKVPETFRTSVPGASSSAVVYVCKQLLGTRESAVTPFQDRRVIKPSSLACVSL